VAIYGIADLHLDFSKEKSMDIFGEMWVNHEEKIFKNWKNIIKEDDVVLIPGDISWALKLKEAKLDLDRIDKLPGHKVISKGNHDYWWQTRSKLNSLENETIHYISNDSYIYNDIAICGTRGWSPKDSDEYKVKDEKIFSRELNRLELSILSAGEKVNKKIAMIHYPPFNIDGTPNEFVDIMKKHGVSICVYGHLHSEGHKFVVEGEIEGIEFYCIASDYIKFEPRLISE